MPRRTLQKDTYYHIYNRGLNHQQLFFEPRDFERFFNNIARFREPFPSIQILAYCLLPNHFHLLIIDSSPIPGLNYSSQKQDPGSPPLSGFSSPPTSTDISLFMNRLQQAYALFFNTKYGEKIKQGLKLPVFEGRFQCKEIIDETYLNHIKTYIEWNAVKHEIVKTPEEWIFSSYDKHTPLLKNIEKDFDPYFS